jgi:two-component system sensor histidine kinase TrcS
MVAMGALYIHSFRTYVIELSDEHLGNSLTAFTHSFSKITFDEPHPRVLGASGADALKAFTGQSAGTLIAVMHDGKIAGSAVFSDDEPRSAPADAITQLESRLWSDGAPVTVRLGQLGEYRLQSHAMTGADVLVSGVSLERANAAIARKTIRAAGLVVLALVLAWAGTLLAIRYALAPLRRVVATAASVAKLPLADPGHRITARVAARDTDPDTEVGIVGLTLNRLLANVDSALVQRAESDRRIRRMLTDASHELRTPLAAIMGYAELTRQDSAELPATTEYALERIESESRRMSALVADLLLLSRLDERQDLVTEEVDLCDVVTNAVNDISVSQPDHDWHLELPDRPVVVDGDLARLHQLTTNLLVNAAIHTPPGTSVIAALQVAPAGAVLTISDNGPGVPAELLPRLFDRFVRADSSRSRAHGNSGLGLPIVQSIAEAHNGSVSVRSTGIGTSFTVVLPTSQPTGVFAINKAPAP